jgi:hypothetical protein
MTSPTNESQENDVANNAQPNNREINFRKQEAMYLRQLDQERQETEKLRQELDASRRAQMVQEDDDDSEPYVNHKKFNKRFTANNQATQTEIQKAMEIAKRSAKEELKQEMWLENNPDFYDVLQKANDFAQRAPKLAENILKMPDNFARQQLVYQTIKEMGIDKPAQKQSTIQDKIDANKRSPYYQPTGSNSAPYAAVGDFSATGQKNAYDKMQQLKASLRI